LDAVRRLARGVCGIPVAQILVTGDGESNIPRYPGLFPQVHLLPALLPKEHLLTGLDELLTILPRPAEQSSSMVLITGPSRTADIEMFLVRGVHGPGAIHVILV